MATPKELSEAFLAWCDKAIAEREDQIEPLRSGRSHVGRRPLGGDWEDITKSRIEQLQREIEGLKIAKERHKEYWDGRF